MGRTIVRGGFEWDVHREQVRTVRLPAPLLIHREQVRTVRTRANLCKHGISFEDAVKVFADPDFLEFRDDEHSTQYEERIKGIGIMRDFVIVVTIFTERTRTRLISARLADKDEEELYYERRFNYD